MEWVIPDDSSEYLENLAIHSETGPKIKHQRLSTKPTLGEKRNITHKLYSGEIIVYMDDDDYPPPKTGKPCCQDPAILTVRNCSTHSPSN